GAVEWCDPTQESLFAIEPASSLASMWVRMTSSPEILTPDQPARVSVPRPRVRFCECATIPPPGHGRGGSDGAAGITVRRTHRWACAPGRVAGGTSGDGPGLVTPRRRDRAAWPRCEDAPCSAPAEALLPSACDCSAVNAISGSVPIR